MHRHVLELFPLKREKRKNPALRTELWQKHQFENSYQVSIEIQKVLQPLTLLRIILSHTCKSHVESLLDSVIITMEYVSSSKSANIRYKNIISVVDKSSYSYDFSVMTKVLVILIGKVLWLAWIPLGMTYEVLVKHVITNWAYVDRHLSTIHAIYNNWRNQLQASIFWIKLSISAGRIEYFWLRHYQTDPEYFLKIQNFSRSPCYTRNHGGLFRQNEGMFL